MFINRKDIITLRNLSLTKELVLLDDIPLSFREDFFEFFFGKTLIEKDSLLFAYPHDVKLWTKFMFHKYSSKA
ncbi:hypothetical protein Belba_3175 [Belliella baltica DSM 15883]|uniref:Uncharacterized protein n=1 Tax=Belliella baltica (strain DSM 15883 / CIP 108006 / LMG 21964 / BA134) TaxID=866536 RepID=I3Z8W9_BELBD|nr:hypothetical protein Belba_3175 [Belliella baltica DSM 15883]